MNWMRVSSLADLVPEQPLLVEVEGHQITLVRLKNDEVLALADRCSHAEASLSEGMVWEDQIECPRHGAEFALHTGEALSLPATKPVETYPTKIQDQEVWLEWNR